MRIQDYEQYVGAETLDRLLAKAHPLQGRHVVHISSTYYGGGVAMMLSSLALLMNDAGIHTDWRTIKGDPSFFLITKTMHNALQGAECDLTDQHMTLYEQVNYENSIRNHLDHDFVIIHDPQPLPLIEHYPRTVPWVWRCHIDLSKPNLGVWRYLRRFIDKYHAVIVSIPEYGHEVAPPVLYFMPAIDPFSLTNRDLNDVEIDACLAGYPTIPLDLPIVLQVSRFDRWKDPQGVIEAFQLARKEVDCTLVLLGSAATDDPEGDTVYKSLLDRQEERIVILNREDNLLVNALQRRAAVVLQKSIKEGFGLTVTEAMWKRAAVIGSDIGGIRYQIQDGVNGFLVSSVQQCAERMVQLLKAPDLRRQLGQAARETVCRKFLMTRLLDHYLDLLNSFEIRIAINKTRLQELRGLGLTH
jgi:trehalose synthase